MEKKKNLCLGIYFPHLESDSSALSFRATLEPTHDPSP